MCLLVGRLWQELGIVGSAVLSRLQFVSVTRPWSRRSVVFPNEGGSATALSRPGHDYIVYEPGSVAALP